MQISFGQKSGFTLIEGIVALAVFSILIVTFYSIFAQTATHLGNSKMRRAAVALANERMEHFRNLPYDEIGTVENAPYGSIVDDEIVNINNMQFRVVVSVFFVDDPIDGSAPADVLFEDYKRVAVAVLWGDGTDESIGKSDVQYGQQYAGKRVQLVSQFVPPGGMETTTTGGILSINVLDADAQAIENAFVTIYDRERDDTITSLTDASGNYMYIGAPACENCYEIIVEKDGYETVATEASYNGTTQIYDPRFVHQSVIIGELTTVAMQIDGTSELVVTSKNVFGDSISDVDCTVIGGRILGTDPNDDGSPVYNLSAPFTTQTDGTYTIRSDTDNDGDVDDDDATNPGPYHFTLEESGYKLWKVVDGDDIDPFQANLLAQTTTAVDLILIDESEDAALISVVDINGTAIDLADVQMVNVGEDYDVMQQTDKYGYVHFPLNAVDALKNGEEYDITVSAAGYEDVSETITIDGLVEQEIILQEI